jgi:hypothetical protein
LPPIDRIARPQLALEQLVKQLAVNVVKEGIGSHIALRQGIL